MLKKDFDGYLEFVKKVKKADKEERKKLYGERTQLWMDKIQKSIEVVAGGDTIFVIAALRIISESFEKGDPEAAALSKMLINNLEYETKSRTIYDMSEAAARAYVEVMKNKGIM